MKHCMIVRIDRDCHRGGEVEDLLGEGSIHSHKKAALQKGLTADAMVEEGPVKPLYSIAILCLQSNMRSPAGL